MDKEYAPIDGDPFFIKGAQKFLFGDRDTENKVYTAQTISGTGALRVLFEFLRDCRPGNMTLYYPTPTYGNHGSISTHGGWNKTVNYKYYDPKTKGIDFEGLKETLGQAEKGSVVMLHACAHNPTGVDPTEEQWKVIANICLERELLPYFDSAYQGFASGDCDKDVFAIRHFFDRGLNMIVAQSFAKNMGLYGERTGALHIVCDNKDIKARIASQIKVKIRANYSNPPIHGGRIAGAILNSPALTEEWKAELKNVSGRIIEMRKVLRAELERIGAPGPWNHITD